MLKYQKINESEDRTQNKPNLEDENLPLPWRITTAPFFLPVLYVSLALFSVVLIYSHYSTHPTEYLTKYHEAELLHSSSSVATAIIEMLYFMPNGIFYFFNYGGNRANYSILLTFPMVVLFSIIIVNLLRNKIPKWIIISLLLLIVTSFVGCTVANFNGFIFFST